MGANSGTQKPAAPAASPFLRGYLEHLANERRLSRHTVDNYARDLAALFALTEGTPLKKLQVHDVRRGVAQLHGRGLDGRTLARMLSAWRGFFHYLARDHGFEQNPCVGIRPPKAAKRLPHALSPDEAGRLMEISAADPLAVRDKAMMELFYSSGLRLSELTGLAQDDVNFRDATLRVTGKGAKTRIVPVGSFAREAIGAYLVRARPTLAQRGRGTPALFLGERGQRLSRQSAWLIVRTAAERAKLGIEISPHTFRHSFATHLLQGGADVRVVQELLGHASVATTQIYTMVTADALRDMYQTAHPRAR